MQRIHLGLSLWLVLFLVAEGALGFLQGRVPIHVIAREWSQWHQLGGLFTAVFVCLVHVVVMWHFIGSGKAMKEALEERHTGADKIRLMRTMKARVYPWSTFAMLFTMAAAIVGGATLRGSAPSWVHLSLAVAGATLNLVAIPIEQRWLGVNARLLRDVEAIARRA